MDSMEVPGAKGLKPFTPAMSWNWSEKCSREKRMRGDYTFKFWVNFVKRWPIGRRDWSTD
jgi:hypothetical protein